MLSYIISRLFYNTIIVEFQFRTVNIPIVYYRNWLFVASDKKCPAHENSCVVDATRTLGLYCLADDLLTK